MEQCLPEIDSFHSTIRTKSTNGGIIESNHEGDTLVTLQAPFESFRTGFQTMAPGIGARRRYGFSDDIERAFYSGYFSGHGIKVQAITLPNGMVGSIYLGLLRISDSSLLNMSNLNCHLMHFFYSITFPCPVGNRCSLWCMGWHFRYFTYSFAKVHEPYCRYE